MELNTIFSLLNGTLTILFLLILYWSFQAQSFSQRLVRIVIGVIALGFIYWLLFALVIAEGLRNAPPRADGDTLFGYLTLPTATPVFCKPIRPG
jgi:RsiW-degrading membrane proteinase PrsW (M82 family)